LPCDLNFWQVPVGAVEAKVAPRQTAMLFDRFEESGTMVTAPIKPASERSSAKRKAAWR
jgi:hypothetical protein